MGSRPLSDHDGRTAVEPSLSRERGPEQAASARICVAQIGGAHGLRGEVRLKAFTAEPMALAQYGPLESKDGGRIEIASLRPSRDMLIARLMGINDRNAAEALRNLRLFVPRERLPAAGEDEFYHADLIGLAVSGTDGQSLGTVVAVPNFGAGDLLAIAPDNGGPSVLLPFTKAMVPTVDIAGRRIVVDPPAGIFPSALAGVGGARSEPGEGAARSHADEAPQTLPPTRSSRSARTTLCRKGRG